MDAADEPVDEEAFEVWRSNWPAFEAFMACATCWRTIAGQAGLIHLGLIYTDVDVVMRHHETPPGSFRDIQVLEAAALAVLAETRP